MSRGLEACLTDNDCPSDERCRVMLGCQQGECVCKNGMEKVDYYSAGDLQFGCRKGGQSFRLFKNAGQFQSTNAHDPF